MANIAPSDMLAGMIQGDVLVQSIDAFQTTSGVAGLWWLGQHSFVLKTAGKVIYIDAYLAPSSSRLVPPLLTPDQVANADFVCGTHDHGDRIDRKSWPAMAAAARSARFVVPEVLRRKLSSDLSIALDRMDGVEAGQTIELAAGVRLTGIAAAHETLSPDPVTGQFAFQGFVIEADGVTVYHAGDTCWYDGLQSALRRWKFDAMLVPINGRDAERFRDNIIGNMTYQEAADLCGPLAPGSVIPTHWDMFARNLGDPGAFARYMNVKYPGVRVIVPNHGATMFVGSRAN